MPVFFEMMQFVGQFPRQFESAEETVQGSFFDDMVLGINNLQHQFSLWLFQPLDQLVVAGLDFLLVFHQGQRGIKSVIERFQSFVHVSRLLAARHSIPDH